MEKKNNQEFHPSQMRDRNRNNDNENKEFRVRVLYLFPLVVIKQFVHFPSSIVKKRQKNKNCWLFGFFFRLLIGIAMDFVS
jgi:protein-tyrosine phosphatase